METQYVLPAHDDGHGTDDGTGGSTYLPTWNIPPRLAHFVGREDLLDDLCEKFCTQSTVAIEGMGGAGKTALAIEYAYRHAADYDAVWWVPAEQQDLAGQYVTAMASMLGLAHDAEPLAVLTALTATYPRWLLIFDNAEDPAVVARFRPDGGEGRLLVTSQRAGWGQLGARMELPTFARDESVALLVDRFPALDVAVANNIADLLGDL
nr:NB-ARC domain-containing protein [Micromonospora sp. DSM 115978]